MKGQVREIDAGIAAVRDGGPTEDEVRDALQKLDPVWNELFPGERERVVRLLVREAIVNADGLDIRLRTNGLHSLVAELAEGTQTSVAKDGATVDVHVPMEFRRRGGRKEIILPPDANTTPDVGPRSPLVVALARAYKWQQMLDSGQVASLNELTNRCGVDRSYVGRIVKLATLAPDIVQMLLAGDDPSGFSLRKLAKGLPMLWHEQHTSLGLTSSLDLVQHAQDPTDREKQRQVQ